MPRRQLAACLIAIVMAAAWLAGDASSSAQAATAARAGASDVAALLSAQMGRAGTASGAAVVDLDTGATLYAAAPDVPRTPASVNKLLVTGAALERLGPAATLSTEALAAAPPMDGVLAGDLWLRGSGDFTFTRASARALARKVVDAGVEVVEGGVIGDESAFDARRGPPSSRYAVSMWVGPLSALSYERGRTGLRWPYWQATPALFAAQAFQRALEAAGVELGRAARRGTAPAGALPVASATSPPLAELARRINVYSDNYGAELLIKAFGARTTGTGSTAAGASAVRASLAAAGAAPRVVDGSGLARSGRVSPNDVVRVLAWMAKQPAGAAYQTSLAVAGRTGTLAKRMRGTAAQDRCRAKTGTLRRISALAGYCTTVAGRRVAFAFLMNGVATGAARILQDRMTASLALYDGI